MPIETWFPTVVYWEDVAIDASVKGRVLEAVRERFEPRMGERGIVITATNTPNDLHLDPRLDPLFEIFRPHFQKLFYETLFIDPKKVEFYVGRCWPVLQADDGTEGGMHTHYGAVFSAVFYLQVPEGSGPLAIYKPFDTPDDALEKTELTGLTFRDATYRAVEDRLIVFSSALKHRRLPNSGPVGERIAVAFDVYATAHLEARTSGMPHKEYLKRIG